MQEPGQSAKRLELPYIEGVNSLVSFNVAKKTEFFHAENARSVQVGSIEKRAGQTVWGTLGGGGPFVTTHNSGLLFFQKPISGTNQGLYRMSNNGTPGLENLYYLNNTNVWTTLSGKGSSILAGQIENVAAEKNMFIVNYNDYNRYISSDGTTVFDSNDAAGHLYNSPKAHLITWYKNKLYVANYKKEMGTGLSGVVLVAGSGYTTAGATATTGGFAGSSGLTVSFVAAAGAVTSVTVVAPGTGYRENDIITITGGGGNATFTLQTNQTTYPTTVLQSSFPLGLVSLLSADNPALGGSSLATPSGTTTLAVTDVKYIYTTSGANSYEIYRGNDLVATITVTAISALSLTVNYTFAGAFTSFMSVDEIWIAGTFTGTKIIRWANNGTATGIDVKQYDTFKLSGGDDDPITMMANIGNDLLIANKNDISSWNGYILQNFDLGMGCVSQQGYVKMLGSLYFIHYSGIYASTGSVPKYISAKVNRYIKGATKAGLEASVAGKKDRSVFFTIGNVTLYYPDGSVEKVLQNVCLEFNSLQENWYCHTNVKTSDFVTFVETNDVDRLILADTSGNFATKEFLSGNTDDGSEIFMRIDFNKQNLNPEWDKYSNPISVMLESERGTSIKTFVSVNEGNPEFYELDGTNEKGISILKIHNKDSDRGDPPVARTLMVSLRDSSLQTCKLNRMAVIFLPTAEEAVIQ